MSATPWSRGLGKHYDDLVIAATTCELIDAGYLANFVAYAPSDPDLSAVSNRAGEFHPDELADAMDTPQITGDIIETWLKRGDNRPTLAFCVNRNHAKHVAERFEEAGVAVEYIDGETSREDRERTFSRFKSGETKVLASIGVLTTGFDADVRCIIDAQPTKSRILFVQKIGRGLRTRQGQTHYPRPRGQSFAPWARHGHRPDPPRRRREARWLDKKGAVRTAAETVPRMQGGAGLQGARVFGRRRPDRRHVDGA
jgi:DNA repair protein RadD